MNLKTSDTGALADPYHAAKIVIRTDRKLTIVESARKRPGMFVGEFRDGSGLHYMILRVIEAAITAAQSGGTVLVTLDPDNVCTIEDSGPGMPTETFRDTNISIAELIMTSADREGESLWSADVLAYPVVNALSAWLEMSIWRGGKVWRMRFEKGEPASSLDVTGEAGWKTGTRLRFQPCPEIFPDRNLQYGKLERRLRQLAALNPGIRIVLKDNCPLELSFEGGLVDYLREKNRLDWDRGSAIDDPITASARQDDIHLEAVFWWGYFGDEMQSFVNQVETSDDGTHVDGFRDGMKRWLDKFALDSGLRTDEREMAPVAERIGFSGILTVRMDDPDFGCAKTNLLSPEVRPIAEQAVVEALDGWHAERPDEVRSVVARLYGRD